MGLLSNFKRLFFPHSTKRICDKVDRLEQRTREHKHALRNLAFRTSAINKLVEDMRGGEAWPRRDNDKRV